MTRHFYTDPLAAAWMAKHHGMWFIVEIEVFREVTEERMMVTNQVGTILANRSERAVIHPDSLHLLEPKYGDAVKWGKFNIGYVSHYQDQPIGVIRAGATGIAVDTEAVIIVQRNGIPFMWPEREAE